MKVGYVVTTYSSPGFIQLQLSNHKDKWNHDIIVADDGSKDIRVKEVCDKHCVPLYLCDAASNGHSLGDWRSMCFGLQHFKGYDWVIKISRRFQWLKDFQPSLQNYKDAVVLSEWYAGRPWDIHDGVQTCCIAFNMHKIEPALFDIYNGTPTVAGNKIVQKYMYDILKKHFGSKAFTKWNEIFKLNINDAVVSYPKDKIQTAQFALLMQQFRKHSVPVQDGILWHTNVDLSQYMKLAPQLDKSLFSI